MVQRSSIDSSVSLRPCDGHDVEVLSLIGQATFLDAFAGILDGADILTHCRNNHSVDSYAALLRQPSTRAYLLEAQPGGAPVGYAMLTQPDLPLSDISSYDIELKRIYVLSRFYGTGAGQRLMQQSIDYTRQTGKRRLLLGVYSGNERALGFYRKIGFQEVGTREFHVGSNRYRDFVLALDLGSGE